MRLRLWREMLQITAREPTLLFEFVRELLKFTAQTPAFEELFQFPPSCGASMVKRSPVLF